MPDAEPPPRAAPVDAGSTGYPPAHHVLRDLDVTTEQATAEQSISLAPVPDAARNAAGAASLGFLVAVLDVNAARVALVAGRPDWTATADLGLHATGWLTGAPVVVDSRLARAGSNTVVVTSEVFDGQGVADLDDVATAQRTHHGLPRVGHGVITFARIPARASVASRFDPAALIGQRRHVGPAAAPQPVPLRDRVGLRVVDAQRGVVELHNHDYVRNSFGTINGGVLGIVFECAAESAVTDLVATDVQIHYVAQAKVGPARTEVDVLRRAADHAVCAIRAIDAGNDDLLLALATVTLQRPP
jgi:acyl-coenzyme A thioesterase PaaI-like protein